MDEQYVQNLIAHLTESMARKIQGLEIDLAVARTERDRALAKLKEATDDANQDDGSKSNPQQAPAVDDVPSV